MRALASVLYYAGLSYRRVSEVLGLLGVKRSYEAVGKWSRKLKRRTNRFDNAFPKQFGLRSLMIWLESFTAESLTLLKIMSTIIKSLL